LSAALEWMGKKEGQRSVSLVLNSAKKQVLIKDSSKLLRTLDVPLLDKGGSVGNVLSADRNMRMMIIQVPKEYDLVRETIYHIILQSTIIQDVLR